MATIFFFQAYCRIVGVFKTLFEGRFAVIEGQRGSKPKQNEGNRTQQNGEEQTNGLGFQAGNTDLRRVA